MNYNDNPLYELVNPLIERMELEKAKAILREYLGTKDYRCTYALNYLAVIAQLENDYQASYDILMEILSYDANNIMAIESLKRLNYLLTSSSPIHKISSPANLLFVGDTLFNQEYKIGPSLTRILKNNTIIVFNSEGTFDNTTRKIAKAGSHLIHNKEDFNSLKEYLGVAALANNHSNDYGLDSLRHSIEYYHKNGILTIGAGDNIYKALNPLCMKDIAIFNIAENEFGCSGLDFPGIASTDYEYIMLELIDDEKKKGKYVIVYSHMGTELTIVPPIYLRKRFISWVNRGVDCIINSHPHVVQGMEYINTKPVYYSIGNFAFNLQMRNPMCRWSLGVMMDTEQHSIKEILLFNDGTTIDVCHEKEYHDVFNRLIKGLHGQEYDNVFRDETIMLFKERYSRFTPISEQDASLLIHYFRSDAHRNSITSYLSYYLMESIDTSESLKQMYRTCTGTHDDKFRAYSDKMQMSAEEKEYLKSILTNCNNYLEIGAGNSTVWASQYVKKMTSIETRKHWYMQMEAILKSESVFNVELIFLPPETIAFDSNGNETWTNPKRMDYGYESEFSNYIASIKELVKVNNYDVILVDGQARPFVVKVLSEVGYRGILLVHDIMPERTHLNAQIYTIKGIREIFRVDTLAEFAFEPFKVEVGTPSHKPGWISTDKNTLDITDEESWKNSFRPNSIEILLAEHVIEHIDPQKIPTVFMLAKKYLTIGGYFRIAVPDRAHPSRFYHHLCVPNGGDIGSEDHKSFFDAESIRGIVPSTFELRLLEWWDQTKFNRANWNNTLSEGFIKRSAQYYDGRITRSSDMKELLIHTTPVCLQEEYKKHSITYTSLIFDIISKDSFTIHDSNILQANHEKQIVETSSTDWLASRPLFYDEVSGKFSNNINDLIQSNYEWHPEGLYNYIEFGYSVFGQTPIKNIKFLSHSSRIDRYSDGSYQITNQKDPAESWYGKISHPDDVLHSLHSMINEWVERQEGPIIVPTSGGLDSRLINAMINDKSRIKAFTYGLSTIQSHSTEVVFAKSLCNKMGINWQQIRLGEYHKFIDEWYEEYGVSTHAHGMYHIEFYNKISENFKNSALISGIVGDIWAGNIERFDIHSINDLVKLGFSHNLNANVAELSNKVVSFDIRNEILQNHHKQLNDPFWQTIYLVRTKMMLLSYLIHIPESLGFKVFAPFLDKRIALGMLTIPYEKRINRKWQREFFKKYQLMVEELNLPNDGENTLNMTAIKCKPLQPLKTILLEKIFNKDYVGKINSELSNFSESTSGDIKERSASVLEAYYAYLTLYPLAKLCDQKNTERIPSKIEQYYNKDYFNYQSQIGIFGGKANLFKFVDYIRPSDIVLDFGCGGGYLLHNMNCKEKLGVEINPIAIEIAKQNGITVYDKICKLPDNIADVVISNHALEHLSNPYETLTELKCKLKYNGKIVFVVPHQDTQEVYDPNDINFHLYTWNQQTLGNLFHIVGYKIVCVETIQHKWPPNYLEIYHKYGEEHFHKLCIEHAKSTNNYQIRIVAVRM